MVVRMGDLEAIYIVNQGCTNFYFYFTAEQQYSTLGLLAKEVPFQWTLLVYCFNLQEQLRLGSDRYVSSRDSWIDKMSGGQEITGR